MKKTMLFISLAVMLLLLCACSAQQTMTHQTATIDTSLTEIGVLQAPPPTEPTEAPIQTEPTTQEAAPAEPPPQAEPVKEPASQVQQPAKETPQEQPTEVVEETVIPPMTEEEKVVVTPTASAPVIDQKKEVAATVVAETSPPEPPTIVEHAKTGYDEPEEETPPPVVEPEPTPSADIAAAVAAAEAYAIDTYNVTIGPTLDFSNSAYRFPAVVPLAADQEMLNAKAVNMVEYTFQQQIRQYGVTIEKMRETGIRCRILIQAFGNDLQTYVFYA